MKHYVIMADSVSNHQPHDCLLNRLCRRRSKKTSKLHVTGLCAGNSPGTGEFPAQIASDAENVSIWWRHHESSQLVRLLDTLLRYHCGMCLCNGEILIAFARYLLRFFTHHSSKTLSDWGSETNRNEFVKLIKTAWCKNSIPSYFKLYLTN